MLGTKGISFATSADPYRYFGAMSPGVNPIPFTVATVQKNTICETVCAADGYGWAFFDDDTIHAFNLTNFTSTTVGSYPHTMVTGCAGFLSSIVYDDYIYFRYKLTGGDAGKSDIGRISPTAAPDETFMSGTAASGAKMDTQSSGMVVGADEKLYIIDGANVHRYDPSVGANGTLYQDKFQIVGGTITAYAKVPNYLVLFVTQTGADASNGECFAYWWDYESTRATYIYPIPGFTVLAGFDNFQGTHGCVVQAKSSLVLPESSCSVLAFTGGQYGYSHLINLPYVPNYNGVECTQDFLFFNLLGRIFSYGQYYPGVSNTLQVVAGTYNNLGSSGLIKKLTSGALFGVTWDGTINSPLCLMNVGYNSYSRFATPQFVPPMPYDYRAKLSAVYINWAKVTSGGHGINVSLLTNKANTTIPIVSNKTAVTEDGLYQKIMFDTSSKTLGAYRFDSIGIDVTYTAGASTLLYPPSILSIECHYTHEKI
jgi:hypothetical protein